MTDTLEPCKLCKTPAHIENMGDYFLALCETEHCVQVADDSSKKALANRWNSLHAETN